MEEFPGTHSGVKLAEIDMNGTALWRLEHRF